MTRDEIDARILARMRREIDKCIERDEKPLLVESEIFRLRTDLFVEMKEFAASMISGVSWAWGLSAVFLFLRIGLAGPLKADVVTTEFWIGFTILLGLFFCLVGREGRRG